MTAQIKHFPKRALPAFDEIWNKVLFTKDEVYIGTPLVYHSRKEKSIWEVVRIRTNHISGDWGKARLDHFSKVNAAVRYSDLIDLVRLECIGDPFHPHRIVRRLSYLVYSAAWRRG